MEVFHGSPLKAPAVEIVDLSSEHGVDDEKRDVEREDASSPETDNGDDDDHLSLYEDMLDSMPEHAGWEDGTSSWE